MTLRIEHTANGDTISNNEPNPVIVAAITPHLHGADITHNHGEHAQGSTLSVPRVMFALFLIAGMAGAFIADLTR